MSHEGTRAGFAAIIGLPNAGKSTLLNRFLGSKLSIVTAAAQTTRERVVGIDTRGRSQIVFLDTPGLVDPSYLLHHSMLDTIAQAIADADVVLLLLDGTRPFPTIAEPVLSSLKMLGQRLIVAINKADIAPPKNVSGLRASSVTAFGLNPFSVSAESGAGVEALREAIVERLPESPFLYPEDDLSTQHVRFFVSELVRETVFERFEDEIPYSVAVKVEEFRESDDPLYIGATIFVERPSQKGILIGRKGEAIRELGSTARVKIEMFLERKVFLDLWVKVLPKWRKSATQLKRLGFPIPREGTKPNA